jgi:hypothetical protein
MGTTLPFTLHAKTEKMRNMYIYAEEQEGNQPLSKYRNGREDATKIGFKDCVIV